MPPDLEIIRAEVADDSTDEPAVLHFGRPDLAQRMKTVIAKIPYLNIRLQAVRGNIDTHVYKEQWIARVVSSMPHLCELLYTFGPPGSGKDVDALFIQELLGVDYCGSLPTGDVICMPNQ